MASRVSAGSKDGGARDEGMGSQPYKASARSWKPLVHALNFESEMAAALAPRMDLARARAPFVPASGGGLHQ